MRSLIGMLAAALLLGTTSLATAQVIESGTIVRVDPQSRVVMLDDGRMYRVTPSTVLVVENRPSTLTALAPGQRVVIQSGEAVTLQGGQYVAVSPSGAVVTPAPPPAVLTPAPSTTVVTQAPVPATSVPVGVRQTIYGTITDVDRNGDVKIKTDRDSFEVRVAPEALRQIKKGDTVTMDLMIAPHGSPAASPR
jgi:preprotein translocase subunit YajC